ncbi:MAG TPA: CheR family methyltransferase [Planctomycetota bacterium]|nr:CheR family methyltransferase [Planctomycetota bacterium]
MRRKTKSRRDALASKARPRGAARRKASRGADVRAERRTAAAAPRAKARATARSRTLVVDPAEDFLIAGVGASAGGVEALTRLFGALRADVHMAFVVLLHRPPQQDSLLPDILKSHAALPVVAPRGPIEPLLPGRIYVVPPDLVAGVGDGVLKISEATPDVDRGHVIDRFFGELATSARWRSVAVILSGRGDDGAHGLADVKAMGGIAMAQDPATARADEMPRAAVAAGADVVKSPEDLATELSRLADPGPIVTARSARGDPGDAKQLERIFHLVQRHSGVDFSHYKAPTMMRRLHRRMLVRGADSLAAYGALLEKDPAETAALYQNMLIHVTKFFRDPEAFAALAQRALPAILAGRDQDEPVRVWAPGCSTGEEAYSVAILLAEQLGDRSGRPSVNLFATDVSEEAVVRARRGVYSEDALSGVSDRRLRGWFDKVDGHYRVAQRVRDMCIFARQDVTRDAPFSRLDLVVCRNLLIYLGPALQKKVLHIFSYALKPNGFLMLGGAETTGPGADLFQVVDKKHRIFARRAGLDPSYPSFGAARRSDRGERAVRPTEVRADASAVSESDRILLDRYAPPSVVVDDELNLRHVRGDVSAFVAPAPGIAGLGILRMAREGVAVALRTALQKARSSRAPVRKEVRVAHHGVAREAVLEVVPLRRGDADGHFLITFATPPGARAPGRRRVAADSRGETGRLRRMQDELDATRREMQDMIQDLEAANEELQSANEEILSSNEELQSTNEELDTAREELQSTNEEIVTVNEELHHRNDELGRVNSDLINLLASVQIAFVMVDNDLRIRRFTPMAETVLNLIPADVGRPIDHIRPNIDLPSLTARITEAIASSSTLEQEIQDRQGRWYSLRIRPYENSESRVEGAVLILLDIDKAKRGRTETALAEALLECSSAPTAVLDDALRILYVNHAFVRALRAERGEILDRSFFEAGGGRCGVPELREAVDATLADGRPITGRPVALDLKGEGRRRFAASLRRLDAPGDGAPRIVVTLDPTPEGAAE